MTYILRAERTHAKSFGEITITAISCLRKDEKNIMVQGTIAGSTSYNNQSLNDILKDINLWKKYSEEINQHFYNFIHNNEVNIENLTSKNLISRNLIFFFSETIKTTETFIEDFQIIHNDIISENITDKTVSLLKNIGEFSAQANIDYGRSWHSDQASAHYAQVSDIYCQLYCRGRDYFVTLQDTSNAAWRLNQYKGTGTIIMQNFNNIFNDDVTNIQQGNNLTMNVPAFSEDILNNLDEKISELINVVTKRSSKDNISEIQQETHKDKPNKTKIMDYLKQINFLENSANITTIISGIISLLNLK